MKAASTDPYFTIQNRYGEETGPLDYAATLLNFGPSESPPGVAPITGQDSLILGQITFRSGNVGTSQIIGDGAIGNPFLAARLNPDSDTVDAQVLGFVDPLTTVDVESGATTPTLTGQASPQIQFYITNAARLGMVLTVTLWSRRSLPPWHGGGTEPVAKSFNVSTDEQGNFHVRDVEPALVPSGIYDLKIHADGALSSLIPDVLLSTRYAPSVTNLPAVILFQGDIDGNNTVDAIDLADLKSSFG